MKILLILIISITVCFWIRNKYFKPNLPKDLELFPCRGVPLVKRPWPVVSEKNPAIGNSVDKDSAGDNDTVHPSLNARHEPVEPPQNVEAIAAVVTSECCSALAVKTNGQIPEDSVLKRHFLAHLASERKSITHPYPTDSNLRRHHENMLAALAARTIDSYPPSIETANVMSVPAEKPKFPEEAALKADFSARLRAEIESRMGPQPADSILRRHYESIVQAEIAERLTEDAEQTLGRSS